MNKKCFKCGAYNHEKNSCRIVYWRQIDELNIEGRCGFYEANKMPKKSMKEILKVILNKLKQ